MRPLFPHGTINPMCANRKNEILTMVVRELQCSNSYPNINGVIRVRRRVFKRMLPLKRRPSIIHPRSKRKMRPLPSQRSSLRVIKVIQRKTSRTRGGLISLDANMRKAHVILQNGTSTTINKSVMVTTRANINLYLNRHNRGPFRRIKINMIVQIGRNSGVTSYVIRPNITNYARTTIKLISSPSTQILPNVNITTNNTTINNTVISRGSVGIPINLPRRKHRTTIRVKRGVMNQSSRTSTKRSSRLTFKGLYTSFFTNVMVNRPNTRHLLYINTRPNNGNEIYNRPIRHLIRDHFLLKRRGTNSTVNRVIIYRTLYLNRSSKGARVRNHRRHRLPKNSLIIFGNRRSNFNIPRPTRRNLTRRAQFSLSIKFQTKNGSVTNSTRHFQTTPRHPSGRVVITITTTNNGVMVLHFRYQIIMNNKIIQSQTTINGARSKGKRARNLNMTQNLNTNNRRSTIRYIKNSNMLRGTLRRPPNGTKPQLMSGNRSSRPRPLFRIRRPTRGHSNSTMRLLPTRRNLTKVPNQINSRVRHRHRGLRMTTRAMDLIIKVGLSFPKKDNHFFRPTRGTLNLLVIAISRRGMFYRVLGLHGIVLSTPHEVKVSIGEKG